MILAATKYVDVESVRVSGRPERRPGAPAVFVPNLKQNPQLLMDWYWRELREGELFRYLQREKATSTQRHRAVARQHFGRRQNNQCDVRQMARIPAREFFRWKAQDADFWSDDNNLRSYRRDNPDALIDVDPLPLPRARFRKAYGESGKR